MNKKAEIQQTSEFRQVNVAELNIDPEAQRKISMVWVKSHIPNFDADQLGYIVVNKRTGGKMYVIDGQHRVELLRSVGWGDQSVHAEMFTGLNQSQEAALFRSRNDRKAVQPIDTFRIGVTAKDPECLAINDILAKHNMKVSWDSKVGAVACVAALRKVYRGGGITTPDEGAKALSNTFVILKLAFGDEHANYVGDIVSGMGLVQLRYGKTVVQKFLVEKLAPVSGGVPGIVGKARAMREIRGRPLDHCVAGIIVDIYNKGRRTGKLDDWE